MRAMLCREPGGPEVLEVRSLPDPTAGPGEVVIDIAAAGINRADLQQRIGVYPPPPGASDVLGMECSGVLSAVGEGVGRWNVGDRVCALLASGGYADKVAVPADQVLPIPDGLDLVHAAALPEGACTVWSNVFMLAALQPGEAFLVHGGGGGIGTMAIQLAHALDARVATTVGSEEKAVRCRELGADLVVNYHEQDFVEEVRSFADGGADVILDHLGASYLSRNLEALATEGRLSVIGLMGGRKAELDLGMLLAKRAAVIASTLRARPPEGKAAIVASVEANVWPLVADGTIKPVVHETIPLSDARRAHEVMEASSNVGKVLLTTGH
jgi:putative PIG3 family NAD(P)H quinone oxidoreductase